jgi:hypothetical protein
MTALMQHSDIMRMMLDYSSPLREVVVFTKKPESAASPGTINPATTDRK